MPATIKLAITSVAIKSTRWFSLKAQQPFNVPAKKIGTAKIKEIARENFLLKPRYKEET